MRKLTIMMYGLVSILLAAVMAATAFAGPMAGSPASPDSRRTAYLGVTIGGITPQQASALKLASTSGAVVADLDRDGPACRAGLKENDVIVGLDGSKIESPEQLGSIIQATKPGKTVTMTVVRSGETKDIKVTLGKWPHAAVRGGKGFLNSGTRWFPPVVPVPDVEVPSFTAVSSRHGLMVENLCPQLAGFFNVPVGTGIMVRSVEKGSPADAAGLKAGDVIVKLNNETIRDLNDWRRVLQVQASQVSITLVREKHEQTMVMHLPAPADSSKVYEEDGGNFAEQMQALGQEMESLRPQLEASQEMLAAMQPSQEELQQMRRDIEKAMKLKQKDIEKMAREMQKSVPTQEQIQKMTRDIVKSVPTQEQIDQMRHELEESMKNWTPQFQQQMQDLQKQMEKQKFDMQQLMKGFGTEHEF